MGFLKKFLRQFGPDTSTASKDDKLDDDLRKLLKRLPNSTKRNLIEELGTDGGSARVQQKGLSGVSTRRSSAPGFAPITEDTPMADEQKEVTAKEYALSLMEVDDLPELKEVKALHKALKMANEDWVASFRDNGGMAGIYKAMAELAESRQDYLEDDGDDFNEHEVPEEEVRLEEELVHCVMILLNKPQGLMTLEASSDLLPLLAGSAIDSSSNYVRCNLLKLLTIVAESGPSGFETVTNALDHVKVDKDEDLRFSILVEAFADADSSGVALVTDLIVFFNTILSSAFEFEERVMLRTEMISAGIIEAMQRIRDYYGLSVKGDDESTEYEGSEDGRRHSISSDGSMSTVVMDVVLASETNDLAAQMDLFDTVMNEDMKDAISTMEKEGRGDTDSSGLAGVDEMSVSDGEASVGGGRAAEFFPDPPAVASMRSVVSKLEGKEETSVMVEVIAASMERMVDAHCDAKQWKKIRDVACSAVQKTLMDSDSEDDDDTPRAPPLPPRPGSNAMGASAMAAGAIPPPPPFNDALIPAAPPLAGMPAAGAIPTPPALPGAMNAATAIPPPPFNAAAAIPSPPPLPGRPAAGTIPTPPALPGMPPVTGVRAIPAPPALPGMPAMGAIPAPPALPGMPAMGAIPAPPALPGMPRSAIPAPPALPGMSMASGIPAPPALPGMGGGLPMPPPLPGMGGAPRPPPLPGMGGLPMPPALPGIGGVPRAPGMPLPLLPRGPAPPKKPKGPKRRPVHWNKIDVKLEKTVFNEIDPSSVDLPMDLLADCFAEKPKEKKKDAPGKGGGAGGGLGGDAAAAAAKKKAAEKVDLLDSKTLRNNGIVFKRFRAKPHDLRDYLVAMDLDKFDTDKLIALRGISPSLDDLPTLKGYNGDLAKLDEVTLFMVLTSKIPRYQARLDCALFMKGFANDADFLSGKLGLVDMAVMEVVESPRLKRLIEVVLAMGNYLNEGTRNGEAKAIKLDSLLKLNTVKTMDKKKTLLHVLMSWAKDKEPDLLLLDEDLVHASEASQWSLTDLKQQVTQLTKGFTLMKAQLKMAKDGVTKMDGDKFAGVVEPFLEGAKDRMESLEAEYGRVQEDYDAAAKRFGEDPTKTPSGDFFTLVSALVDMISVGIRENELSAKAEERRKKRELQEKKRREAKAKKELEARASAPPPMTGGGRGGRGSMRGGMMASSRQSFRPSQHGFGGRGLGGSAAMQSSKKPLGLGVNEAMLQRRGLIAVGPEEDDDDDFDWDDEEGAVQDEYERIKTRRVNEAVMFKQISKLRDASKREIARGQLPYQKSTLGKQQSMTRQRSGLAAGGGVPTMKLQVSAIRQASNLRQMTAIKQASIAQRGFGGRKASNLRPSNAGGGMGRMGGLSTGRLESSRLPSGPPGLNRRGSADGGTGGGRSTRGEMASDPRKQFKTLKSTAFLA